MVEFKGFLLNRLAKHGCKKHCKKTNQPRLYTFHISGEKESKGITFKGPSINQCPMCPQWQCPEELGSASAPGILQQGEVWLPQCRKCCDERSRCLLSVTCPPILSCLT